MNLDQGIAYFGLTEWWDATFDADAQRVIRETYKPFIVSFVRESPTFEAAVSGADLVDGAETLSTTQSAMSFLGGLATWFDRPGQRDLARQIFAKALEVDGDVLDLHFLYQHMIRAHYRERDTRDGALMEAVTACESQIALAPSSAEAFRSEYLDQPLPAHVGYQQLCIILEKQGRFSEASDLVRRARDQGWGGDWDRRLERLAKKVLERK